MHKQGRQQGHLRVTLMALIVLAPGLMTLVWVRLLLGADLQQHVPLFSDELMNWLEVNTYRAVGFEGGHFSLWERPSPSPLFSFYAWGVWHPIFYGSLARLTGWGLATPVLFNVGVVTAALGVYLLALRPRLGQLLALLTVLLTFWPLWLYLPSHFQESLQHAWAILLAVAFAVGLRRGRFYALVLVLLVGFAALWRLTWVVLWVPALTFWLARGDASRWRAPLLLTLALAFAVGLSVQLFEIYSRISAPYPLRMLEIILHAPPGYFDDALRLNIGNNLRWLSEDGLLQASLMARIVVVASMAGAVWLRAWWRRQADVRDEALLHGANLTGIVVIMVGFYEFVAWRDYRVFAPHLLLTLLVLIAQRRYRLVGALTVAAALMLGPFVASFMAERAPNFHSPPAVADRFAAEVADVIVYDPNAPSAWCNTLLVGDLFYDYLGLPAGMGLSSYLDDPERLSWPLRSRYVLEDARWNVSLDGEPGLRRVKETSMGGLYINEAADCD